MMDIKTLAKFYKNKKVLVTGADGFIGSHLVEKLLDLGSRVSVFVRGTSIVGSTGGGLRNIKQLVSKFERIIAGNIAAGDSV